MSAAAAPFIYLIRFLRLALGSLLIIGTTQLVVDHHEELEVQRGEAIAFYEQLASDGISTIPSDHAGPGYEDRFVHVQGVLDTGTIIDPLTGMTLPDLATGLRRTVEMLQWQEKSSGSGSFRSYKYTTLYSERLIDSGNFMQKDLFEGQVHNNPKQLPHETGVWLESSRLTLGAWPLEHSYTDLLAKETGVIAEKLTTETDGWQVSDGYVIPTGQDTEVGSFRILYAQRSLAPGQYSAIGLVKEGVLSRRWFGNNQFNLPLLARGNVSAEVLVAQALLKLGEDVEPSRSWMIYVFMGLLLCIGVIARFFPHHERFTGAPFPRRAVVTIVIAVIGTALVGTLM